MQQLQELEMETLNLLNPFQSNTVKLFNGKAMIIIKSKNKPDTIKIKASSKKLKQTSVTLTVL